MTTPKMDESKKEKRPPPYFRKYFLCSAATLLAVFFVSKWIFFYLVSTVVLYVVAEFTYYVVNDLNSGLHLSAMNGRSTVSVASHLKWSRWMLYLRNGDGQLPLHCACHPRTGHGIDAVRPLIQAFPNGSWASDLGGRTPLFHAFRDGIASDEVIRCLLDARPLGPTYPDNDGETPLSTLWAQYRSKDWSGFRSEQTLETDVEHGLRTDKEMAALDSIKDDRHIRACWRAMCAMVRSAYPLVYKAHHVAKSPDVSASIVHCCAGLGHFCPPGFIDLAISVHLPAARTRDKNGELPLHIAARTKWNRVYRMRPGEPGCARDPREFITSPCAVQSILKAYPEAARYPNQGGRLPLNIAIAHGLDHELAIKPLIHAAPDVLRLPDEVTGLYPFMLSASVDSSSSLETTFELLRADPSLVE